MSAFARERFLLLGKDMPHSSSAEGKGRLKHGGKETVKVLLSEELSTYEKCYEHLLATAEGRFALVKGRKVHGTYDSQSDALAEGYRLFGLSAFLVKQVVKIETPQSFVSNLLAV